ncbi:hypothetical protein QN277_000325 [Acacia crassicarpa]|uniref:Uncharacterized protein n=1 Tax=Acacia crassicarpa TaxID=499986 RepID=A0AAE1TH14_9FABA|nr:hypothetical protein QN277_000325 [Acacia crassicarpa]
MHFTAEMTLREEFGIEVESAVTSRQRLSSMTLLRVVANQTLLIQSELLLLKLRNLEERITYSELCHHHQ